MKKLVNVKFKWIEPSNMSIPFFQLEITFGTFFGNGPIRLSLYKPDERGWTFGAGTPLLFYKDLDKAKKEAENWILAQLKS